MCLLVFVDSEVLSELWGLFCVGLCNLLICMCSRGCRSSLLCLRILINLYMPFLFDFIENIAGLVEWCALTFNNLWFNGYFDGAFILNKSS